MAEIEREIPIFIASSMKEFKRERKTLAVCLDKWNDIYQRIGVRVVWPRPEIMSRALLPGPGGSQGAFDEKVRACEVFLLIVGERLGWHTEAEFDLAWERAKAHGRPLILPYFLKVYPSMEVLTFRDKVRRGMGDEDAEQYTFLYDTFDSVLNHLQWELTQYAISVALDGEAPTIRMVTDKEKSTRVEPNALLVREAPIPPRSLELDCHVELDTTLEHMELLWEQRLYDRAIKPIHRLEYGYKNNEYNKYYNKYEVDPTVHDPDPGSFELDRDDKDAARACSQETLALPPSRERRAGLP